MDIVPWQIRSLNQADLIVEKTPNIYNAKLTRVHKYESGEGGVIITEPNLYPTEDWLVNNEEWVYMWDFSEQLESDSDFDPTADILYPDARLDEIPRLIFFKFPACVCYYELRDCTCGSDERDTGLDEISREEWSTRDKWIYEQYIMPLFQQGDN